jgi:AhpD family alkylhydroperoxidase
MTRIQLSETNAAGYRRVVALNAYVDDAVDPALKDMVFLRASYLNGCNYCVDAHSHDLLADGVPQRKAFAVGAWRHSEFFTERERLALELTDAITAIGEGGVSDDLYRRALGAFSEQEVGDLILAIGLINLWNRIGVSTLMQPEEPLG